MTRHHISEDMNPKQHCHKNQITAWPMVSQTANKYSRTPLIQIANYPYRLGPLGKFVENSTKLTCLEITGYQIKNSSVLWLIELHIRCGQKVQMQVCTVNSNS
jgi:hypothetical protein